MRTYVIRILIAIRRAAVAFVEFNREQMRFNERWLARDAYTVNAPSAAPDTYAEFLLRTRGPLAHEPSARARLDGHPVH
jgi:hypothetical protein